LEESRIRQYGCCISFIVREQFRQILGKLSIRVTPSNNKSISELANQSIANYGQNYASFQLIESKAVTLKGNPSYILKYQYIDQLFGKVHRSIIWESDGYEYRNDKTQ